MRIALIAAILALSACGDYVEMSYRTRHGLKVYIVDTVDPGQAHVEEVTGELLKIAGIPREFVAGAHVEFHGELGDKLAGYCFPARPTKLVEYHAGESLRETAFKHELIHLILYRLTGDVDERHEREDWWRFQ